MKKISQFMSDNPRYNRFKKPLEAASVCDSARAVAQGRFEVISFREGLLTLSVSSSSAAGNLQAESQELIDKINQKIGRNAVLNIRFKIV